MSKRKIIKYFSLTVAIITFLFASQSPKETKPVPIQSPASIAVNTPTPTAIDTQLVKVARVVDGDTFKITSGETVRMIGINTPETVDPRRPVQCFGAEAGKKTKELLEGKTIRLEKDVSEKDKYGRLLRYVFVKNADNAGDVFINEYLVREGFAYAYSYPPDVKYAEVFKNDQIKAKEENKGLWNTNVCPTSK